MYAFYYYRTELSTHKYINNRIGFTIFSLVMLLEKQYHRIFIICFMRNLFEMERYFFMKRTIPCMPTCLIRWILSLLLLPLSPSWLVRNIKACQNEILFSIFFWNDMKYKSIRPFWLTKQTTSFPVTRRFTVTWIYSLYITHSTHFFSRFIDCVFAIQSEMIPLTLNMSLEKM